MISIEYALDKYTDMINEKQVIDLEYFKELLLPSDYKEFLEEIKYINKIKSAAITETFEKIFDKIDKYKEEIYQMAGVVNFRSKNVKDENIKKIEEIFKDEFEEQ